VAFRVYDGRHPPRRWSSSPQPDPLLYESHPEVWKQGASPAFDTTTTMNVAGHSWTIAFASLPYFGTLSGQLIAAGIAVAGVLTSFLLFAVTQSEVRARAVAQASQAARDRFFAAMSHELRTPINAVVGYNDLLLAGVFGPLAPKQQNGIERSQKAARHLTELVNDVLDLSKIEAGKIDLEMKEVRISALIDDLFTTMRPVADVRGCELRLHASPSGDDIRTDPRRLRQILLNLLSNATNFGAGHPVSVHCSGDGDGGVQIEVVDRGPGIAAKDLSRVFEEFVQLNHGGGGTGLGLPISRRLAELLGGRLEVESSVGSGSVFRLLLPREPRLG
jgi:signal transduction histidine kinase